MLEFLVLGEIPGTNVLLDPVAVYNAIGILSVLLLTYLFYRHKVTQLAKETLVVKQKLSNAI